MSHPRRASDPRLVAEGKTLPRRAPTFPATSNAGAYLRWPKDQETQRQMFEPFFTAKPQGSGTGLGLATVFGIVKQSGGSIHVKSETGIGTTFWVDLPKAETAPIIKEPRAIADLPKGTETILVVEDEDAIRGLIVQTLTAQGYTILAASHGADALVKLQAADSGIDLLLTDMIMPGEFNGRQLAQRVRELQPETRLLLMSGYTTDDLAHYGVSKGVPFLRSLIRWSN